MYSSEDRIICRLQLRDGCFGKSRLRSRKGLLPTGDIVIVSTDSLPILIAKVREKLPRRYNWDDVKEPIRYQKSKDQPQHSLEPITPDTPFFHIFAELYLRYKRRNPHSNEFAVNLWIFGKWYSDTPESSPESITQTKIPTKLLDILSSSGDSDSYTTTSPDRPTIESSNAIATSSITKAYAPLLPHPERSSSTHKPQFVPNSHHFHPYAHPNRFSDYANSSGRDRVPNASRRLKDDDYVTLKAVLNGQVVPLKVQMGSLRDAFHLC